MDLGKKGKVSVITEGFREKGKVSVITDRFRKKGKSFDYNR